jgi:hypothetical protein
MLRPQSWLLNGFNDILYLEVDDKIGLTNYFILK